MDNPHQPYRTSRGVSVVQALIGVVALGVASTVAIPRIWSSHEDAMDAQAISELKRATAAIDGYFRQHGELPARADDVGFTPAGGVEITMWKRQTVSGVVSVHIHARHMGSRHSFHAHHPLEPAVTALDWEW